MAAERSGLVPRALCRVWKSTLQPRGHIAALTAFRRNAQKGLLARLIHGIMCT